MFENTPATKEEIKIYEKVKKVLYCMDDKMFNDCIEDISQYVFNWGEERKKAYSKLKKWAKLIQCKIKDLETWYYIIEA